MRRQREESHAVSPGEPREEFGVKMGLQQQEMINTDLCLKSSYTVLAEGKVRDHVTQYIEVSDW